MDKYGYTYEDNSNKLYPYYFCSMCMDGNLIYRCEERILEAFRQQQQKAKAEEASEASE